MMSRVESSTAGFETWDKRRLRGKKAHEARRKLSASKVGL
jgi:hypothetical protein